jgi:hypothetical protein
MLILSIKERKDGSADMMYELNQTDITIFKKIAKERGVHFSKKFCNQLILDGLDILIKEK